jgi:hypothetical protein
MGKPKTHPTSCPRLVYSDSYFGLMFNPFFIIFCNRSGVPPLSVPVYLDFKGVLKGFEALKKGVFEVFLTPFSV